jgi:hypothetical protein
LASLIITYRQLSSTGDPLWGQGTANYLSNLEAVAQAVLTRLQLFQGEWWASTTDGLPLWQSILGQPAGQQSQQQMATLISARILGTPWVIGLASVAVTFNSQTRMMGYTAVVNTQFGTIVVTNLPTPTSGVLPQ